MSPSHESELPRESSRTPFWVRWVPVAVVVALVVLVGLGLQVFGSTPTDKPETRGWTEIAERAQGQTVRLWMWDGSADWNAYVDRLAETSARRTGVRLIRVPVGDTSEALDVLLADGGGGDPERTIDLVWVNGAQFARGREANVWRHDWVSVLPNSALLDPGDPTLWSEFGIPTEGREMPWARAALIFAYDRTRLSAPPRSFEALLRYAWSNPGRVAYPAPPQFTGSAFVRQAVAALGEERAFQLLRDLDPLLWEGGERYPSGPAELQQLFTDGQIDLLMDYNPSFVGNGVKRGDFPRSMRPYTFDGGTLQNVNFLALPNTAQSPEGAMVVANLMLSPAEQVAKAEQVGAPSVLPGSVLSELRESPSVYRLTEFGRAIEELPAERVDEIDERWVREFGSAVKE